jgi:glycosyltransferase involved in cell wall biosynthesis
VNSAPVPARYRLLLVLSHPVQYVAPLLRLMAAHPRLEILVAYASLRGATRAHDPGFGVEVEWDVPVLEGYPWVALHRPAEHATAMPPIPYRDLSELLRTGGFDAIYAGGYYFRDAWRAFLAARLHNVPLLLSTDAHSLDSWRVQSPPRRALKKVLLRQVYRCAKRVLAGSSGTVAFLESLGVPPERILLAGNVVDNDWWTTRASHVDLQAVRQSWNIPAGTPVALFCGKLQPWKRPQDAMEALARANAPDAFLVFAGDGSLHGELQRRAQQLGIAERVRWLGFVNQSQLPAIYAACDVLVLPSSYEPFGLVVNEAMLCGCSAIISDRVGAKFDLVRDGETGFVYPCGDIKQLSARLSQILTNSPMREHMSAAARKRMSTWRPEQNVEAYVKAVAGVAEGRHK